MKNLGWIFLGAGVILSVFAFMLVFAQGYNAGYKDCYNSINSSRDILAKNAIGFSLDCNKGCHVRGLIEL